MSWRRLVRDERGNMATLFAMAFSLCALMSALVVDAGALYHERRLLQTGVDLAAIAAASDPTRARPLAEAALANAGLAAALAMGELEVTVGHYAANPALAPEFRFIPNAAPLNAAIVTMRHPGTLYFANGLGAPPDIAARGMARVIPEVSFTLGSRLASLDAGIANAVLGTLLGTSVSLSVMDYNRLAAARVNALDFLDALALEMGVEAGRYDDLLQATAGAGQIAAALARIVNGTEKGLLSTLALSGPGNGVALGKLLDLGRFGRLDLHDATATLAADLSVLEILTAAAALGDGARQMQLSLGSSLPAIADFTVDLVIGEPPQGGGWFALGPNGTVVRTAQLRLRIALRLLAGSVVSGGVLTLPVWLDIAPAQARVLAATCPSADDPRGTATIAVLPGVLTLAIGMISNGQLTDFGVLPPLVKAKLLDALLLGVSGSARVAVAQVSPIHLAFSSDDIAGGVLRTARTQTLVGSLAASLFGDLDLTIDLLGIGLGLNAVTKSIGALLAPVAPTLDLVLDNMLHTLGLGVGEADVRVYGVTCTDAALVG